MVRNPDRYREKMEAMDMVRKRQQEQYEAAARLLAEREREKEEEKRRQRFQELENLVTIQSFFLHKNGMLRHSLATLEGE